MKKIYLLLGFGVSNQNIFKFLNNLRKKVLIYDDDPHRTIPILYRTDDIPYESIKYVIVSPGIPPTHPMVLQLIKKGIQIITDLDFLYLYNKKQKKKAYYVGITGSNGKTTTVTLIHQLLAQQHITHVLCGNVGLSPFTNIHSNNIYIIELSSFQLHYMKHLQLDISLILNIESNHDQWHGSFESYKESKLSIETRSKLFLSLEDNPWSIHNRVLYYHNAPQLEIVNVIFTWYHNQSNLLNALWIFTLIHKQYKWTLPKNININSLTVPMYRQEIIYKKNFFVINDSKSTSMGSTKAALDNFSKIEQGKMILLIGGLLKGDISLLTEMEKAVEKILLFGASSKDENVLRYIKDKEKYSIYETLEQAIYGISWDQLTVQWIILFSPGGASYDEFKNYEARGRFFTESIKKILLSNSFI